MPECAPDYWATPHQVAEYQRQDVADALLALGPDATPERLSEHVTLAVSVVVRRLAELRAEQA